MKPGMSLSKHYLQFKDFRAEEYSYLFERTAIIKKRFKNYEKYTPLVDRTLAMIFEKNSTRTRFSFDAAMRQLGGDVIISNAVDMQLGRGEPIEDTARVLSRSSATRTRSPSSGRARSGRIGVISPGSTSTST